MANYDVNSVVNGLYGAVYDENGQEIQSTQEFSTKLEFEKATVKVAGRLMEANKIVSAKGTGSMKLMKIDSRLQQKIAENPAAKYNYLGQLADPTARGEEAVMYIGVSFDGTPLTEFTLGELAEVDLEFTFDDFRYVKSIS